MSRCCYYALRREEIEGVGYQYARYEDMVQRYDPQQLKDGWNEIAGEQEPVYFISNPAQGLWAVEGSLLQ